MWGAIGPDMVPIFEEQATRVEFRYTMQTWMALDPLEKAMNIAIRRVENAMKNIQADAEIRNARKAGKR